MEEKLTFEGRPIAVFHDKEIVTEARKVQDETVKTLKRMIGGTIKPKYELGKMKNGEVRYYSDEEVSKMNQQIEVQNVTLNIPVNRKTKKKLEKLLGYIAYCISTDRYFHVATHISKNVDGFYEFMGDSVSRSAKIPYHRSTLYQDLKKLVKYEKIYSKGNPGARQYFIVMPSEQGVGLPENNRPEREVEVLKEQPGGSMPDIVQRVVLDVVVNVKINFTS